MILTQKEYAKELVKKFDKLLPCEGTTTGQTPIECALISIKDTIKVLNSISDLDVRGNVLLDLIQYCREVEQETEKL